MSDDLPPLEDHGWYDKPVHTGEFVRVTADGRQRVIEDTPKLFKHWKRYLRAAWEEASRPQKVYGVLTFIAWHALLWVTSVHFPRIYQLMSHGGH